MHVWGTCGEMLGVYSLRMRNWGRPREYQAIQDMPTPKSVRDMQQLSGCIAYLGRFLACMGEKILQFYQLLKGGATFTWTSLCQQAFEQLKAYLSKASLLVSPVEGETLFMYLAVTKAVVSSILCSFMKWNNDAHLLRESCISWVGS